MICPECGEFTSFFNKDMVLPVWKKRVVAQMLRGKYGLAVKFALELIECEIADVECYLLYLRAASEDYTLYNGEEVERAVKEVTEAYEREGYALTDADAARFIRLYNSAKKPKRGAKGGKG